MGRQTAINASSVFRYFVAKMAGFSL